MQSSTCTPASPFWGPAAGCGAPQAEGPQRYFLGWVFHAWPTEIGAVGEYAQCTGTKTYGAGPLCMSLVELGQDMDCCGLLYILGVRMGAAGTGTWSATWREFAGLGPPSTK
uniref:Uncharacterized protein n=1 Tax=Eutreptiella gymnastica TaxID=73025 RepID=A0A7S1N724_9EUGL